MKKIAVLLVLLFSAAGLLWLLGGSRTVPPEKTEAVQSFLKAAVVESLEKDYQSHGIPVTAAVTDLKIDRITKKETRQDNVYFAWGRVSYLVRGPKTWRDREGNLIHLGSGQTITHWFSCGVLEDRYLGTFRQDDKNRLQFYADNPLQ